MKNIVHTILLSAAVIFAVAGYSCKKYDNEPNRDEPCKVILVTIITEKVKVKDDDGKDIEKDVVFKNDTIRMEILPGKFIAPLPVFSAYSFDFNDFRYSYVFDAWYTDAPSSRTPAGTTPNLPPYDLATKPIWLDMTLYSRWLKESVLNP